MSAGQWHKMMMCELYIRPLDDFLGQLWTIRILGRNLGYFADSSATQFNWWGRKGRLKLHLLTILFFENFWFEIALVELCFGISFSVDFCILESLSYQISARPQQQGPVMWEFRTTVESGSHESVPSVYESKMHGWPPKFIGKGGDFWLAKAYRTNTCNSSTCSMK